jgi:hypothetical protein
LQRFGAEEMKIAIALLLPLLAFSIPVLAQDPDLAAELDKTHAEVAAARAEMNAQMATVIKTGRVFSTMPNPCGDPNHISHEFLEIAGDTFDEVLSLEAAQLKAQNYFEPILHDAERATLKVKRKASNADEGRLAECLTNVRRHAELYRGLTKTWNIDKRSFQSSQSERDRKWVEEDVNFIRIFTHIQKDLDDRIRELLKQRA